MKATKIFGYYLLGLLTFILLAVGSFYLGQWWMKERLRNNTEEARDTVIVKDTVRIPGEALPAQVIREEVVSYKPVPVIITDTIVAHDTLIQVVDGVAVVPITMKTYTDSSTYRAVISGYNPQLEEIEVYRDNMTVTVRKKETQRWGVGVQAGVGVGLFNQKPDVFVGLGVQYNLWP